MGFNNPNIPWSKLEQLLSDRLAVAAVADPLPTAPASTGAGAGAGAAGDGGDAPAWSRRRAPYRSPTGLCRQPATVPYAELHCHSNFSFLDGASHPEELVEEAARLGLEALAVTDHNGLSGVVRFAEAARAVGLPTVFGAELTLAEDAHGQARVDTSRPGPPDPEGRHLVVLARGPAGYAGLARAISHAQMSGSKGRPRIQLEELAAILGRGNHRVLTGCRKGTVPAALVEHGPAVARRELDRLVGLFGREAVAVELWDHHDPLDGTRNDALAEMAVRAGVEMVATNNVHYATPSRRRLATALAAVRARRSLDDLDGWLPGGGTAHLRSGAEQSQRFARYPDVVAAAARIGRECAFDLRLMTPALPPYPCPADADGTPRDEMTFLRYLVRAGAATRYGAPGSSRLAEYVRRVGQDPYVTLAHELNLIESLGFAGYFLIVWDLVEFCRVQNIYCQGRGSAANSAVCYALGITNADAVGLNLLFERFLSPERDGPPDIDIDIESGRREEVIQYVYERYGREYAAQVANVITYRAKSSVRDMARALGFAPGQQDAWSKQIDRWAPTPAPGAGPTHPDDPDIPLAVLELAAQVEHFPRHLGIHSGGMVICDRPVIEVCPIEWAAKENRSILQWDKDDCAAVGLVKFDLLGLGMLTAIHLAVDLIAEHHQVTVDLATLPQDPAVYDMICAADTIGVFQIESRAQMATLPRLRPRTFYDLVVEVALIRPGPIQGGSVHPYIRRRNGQEPVTYLHPLLKPALEKTLGIPLFQEQLMQMAIDVAGFTPGEADELRQAMGSKRSRERMERLRQRLFAGMAARGIEGDIAEEIYAKLAAFASYGFPESHSVSFAYLVYASSWIKFHYPAAFCAALLNAQPMGFYSPHSLVQDARRHGVVVRTPDINASARLARLEPQPDSTGGMAVRLGFESVRSVGEDLATSLAAAQPYTDVEDVARRGAPGGVSRSALEALATAGAFGCFDLDRRQSLWSAGAAARSTPDRLPGMAGGLDAPQLPGMSDQELAMADLWATGVSPDGHPTRFLREDLARRGVSTAAGLATCEPGSRVWVAGVVTHRQRPATAGGTMFINLEDETGLINVVCSVGCWTHHRGVVRSAAALLIRGRLERSEGVTNVIAERIEALAVEGNLRSRDFR
jgi:error-prone DNA polymerase